MKKHIMVHYLVPALRKARLALALHSSERRRLEGARRRIEGRD